MERHPFVRPMIRGSLETGVGWTVTLLTLVALGLGSCDGTRHEPSKDGSRSAAGDLSADDSRDTDTPAAAAEVVRDYYQAVQERRFEDAYRAWGGQGAASGKSFEQFRAGFDETATVRVEIGRPGPMGAAAGSRYVEVPVRIFATTRSGARQEFGGRYTLRRSVVDGATLEQRTWHINSASIHHAR